MTKKRSEYAELHCHSFYSFLDGASSPEELVTTAAELGLSALAVTDHDGLYGVGRFAEAAADVGLPTVFGAELGVGMTAPRTGVPDPDGAHLLVLARTPGGYRRLSAAISEAQTRGGEKGLPRYDMAELGRAAASEWLVLTGCRKSSVGRALATGGAEAARTALAELVEVFGRDNVAVELTVRNRPTDLEINDALADLAAHQRVPVVATNNVHYATPRQFPLATTMAAIRANRSLDELDGWLPAADTAYLRSPEEMAYLFRRWPQAVANAARLGEECAFELRLIAPELPRFPVPDGHDLDSWLREKTMRGALRYYGPPETEDPAGAYDQIDHELTVIRDLGFAGYFLIVDHIVQFCRDSNILCQGRGSAANSAICFALGITRVDAVRHGLMFERFLSPERDGYPDIDLDIESGRREEVIQFVYEHYGRERAAMVANVISYRPKLAVRDTARALGYSPGQADAWSKHLDRYREIPDDAGIPERVVDIARQLMGAPRHLGIHPGGMVLADRPVTQVCPVEWARKEDRTVLQWDKDDCAYAGLVKFDLLGLGMLSAIRYATDLIAEYHGERIDLSLLDKTDPAVYDLLCRADSIGLFQVESRAQISTLPRLQPREFYDLAIQVALIRPGPIQGNAVNPYLLRRKALRKWEADPENRNKTKAQREKELAELWPQPHPVLRRALDKTLGVPLFQEQLMTLTIDAAKFTAAEADQLRRAMGSKRSEARMAKLKSRMYEGMARTGITGNRADDIWAGLEGFAAFGFPESHAISFAFIVYSSAWLKLYYPAAFYAGLLNAQPMGFYSVNSLIADARRHGVRCLRPDINASGVKATLERVDAESGPAIRQGLSTVRGIGETLAEALVAERAARGPFRDTADVAQRVRITAERLENLSTAGAFDGFGVDRRQALWQSGGVAAYASPDTLPGLGDHITAPTLPGLTDSETMRADLWATRISPETHPMEHVRPSLGTSIVTVAGLKAVRNKTRVDVAGVITHRQRPATASGITFLSLEDETGILNVVCSVGFWNRTRTVARLATGVIIRGLLEHVDGTMSLVAERIRPLNVPGAGKSRDFR